MGAPRKNAGKEKSKDENAAPKETVPWSPEETECLVDEFIARKVRAKNVAVSCSYLFS